MVNNKEDSLSSTQLVIYQTKNETIKVDVIVKDETVWLSFNQMATIFERDKSVISRHLKNIFKTAELNPNQVVAFFATTTSDKKDIKLNRRNTP